MADTDVMEGKMERPMPEAKPAAEVRTFMVASLAENLAGGGAIALAIIGLAGIVPSFVAAIAVLAIGTAFLFEGAGIAARLSRLMKLQSGGTLDAAEFGGGMSAEFFAGLAGVTLGILAIVGMVPAHLIAIAVLVFGAAIMRGSRSVARINSQMIEYMDESREAKNVANELVMSAEGVHLLIGMAAVILGIIAVIGKTEPMILSLVGLLIIGFGNLLSGKAVNGKVLSVFHHHEQG
jgi:hypothetical protein